MKGTKYLSELVDFDQLSVNVVNIIMAPTGCGKTYFALKSIPEHCSDPLHQALYLIDTINGKEQILSNYNALPATRYWIDSVGEGCAWETRDERVVIMTYALLGCILQTRPDFCKEFKYIICDELHSLMRFERIPPRPNSHTIAKMGLERIAEYEGTILVALTATPFEICTHFNAPYRTLLIDPTLLRKYETKRTKHYHSLRNVILDLDPNQTGLCYSGRITKMKEIAELATEAGLRPIAIWSTNNTDHLMDDEQLRVRDIILEDYTIPPEYNFLIINSSSETSIKIKSKVDYVIVNHSNKDVQTQVRGRIDNDLDTLYLPAASTDTIIVPDEFLNVELFDEDKKRLCKEIDIKGKNGRQLQWTGVSNRLKESSSYYTLKEGRKNNRRYVIITEKQ